MKKILLICTLFFSCIQISFAIDFYKGTYADALEKGKKENKLILLYFTATWCGPCKYMQQYIFPNAALKSYINQNYIALKFDIDTKEGKLIYVKSHQPKGPMGVPAFIIMNNREEVLKKKAGAMKLVQFQEFLLKDGNSNVVYKLLADSLAQKQMAADEKKPTTWSKFYFTSSVSNWKPALKIGTNLSGFSTMPGKLTMGYELGFYLDRSFERDSIRGFWHASRYNFEPGIMLTSKGGVLLSGNATTKVNLHYLELGLFNSYQIKGFRGLQLSVNPYGALALWGNYETLGNKQALSFQSDFKRLDYGVKLGIAKSFGSFKPFVGYNLGLADIKYGPQVVHNRGYYLSFALIVGK